MNLYLLFKHNVVIKNESTNHSEGIFFKNAFAQKKLKKSRNLRKK
jgi:hypothetical protein